MSINNGSALAWGTLVYILLGAIATAFGMRYFDKSTSGTKEERSENAKLVAIHVPLATFCLWIMWATCWLHQWHPLIMPTVSTENS